MSRDANAAAPASLTVTRSCTRKPPANLVLPIARSPRMAVPGTALVISRGALMIPDYVLLLPTPWGEVPLTASPGATVKLTVSPTLTPDLIVNVDGQRLQFEATLDNEHRGWRVRHCRIRPWDSDQHASPEATNEVIRTLRDAAEFYFRDTHVLELLWERQALRAAIQRRVRDPLELLADLDSALQRAVDTARGAYEARVDRPLPGPEQRPTSPEADQ